MSEPREFTGDPWIDAYLTFRRAWLDGATEGELTDLAAECRRGLPNPAPPIPAALFIHRDIVITAGQKALTGTVPLGEAGAGEIVDSGWSDRQGQLVEGSQDPEVYYFLSPKFVVSAADILDESVPGSDHSCTARH